MQINKFALPTILCASTMTLKILFIGKLGACFPTIICNYTLHNILLSDQAPNVGSKHFLGSDKLKQLKEKQLVH